jgi:CheY-like chemotaxis protein
MAAPLAGRTILVVDDRESMLELLADVLADAGAEVVACSRPQDALDALRLRRFDAIVSDLRMPGIDGLELLRRARVDGARAPAIAITGADEWQYRDPYPAVRAGFDMHLSKPVEPAALVQAVTRLVT